MQELPSIWRTELYHPLTVHFPIALLMMATLFLLYGQFKKWPWSDALRKSGRLLLWLGVIAAWVAVNTGSKAYDIVGDKLCDFAMLQKHANLAEIAAYLFTGALLLDIFTTLDEKVVKASTKKWLTRLCLIFMLGGSVYLTLAAHLGAEVVYQQGAAVYHPSADCHEFNTDTLK